MSRFRILSLDGGGTWALIQVMVLQRLFGPNARGHEVLTHFDLVTGNSGGSIVAACLFADMPLQEVYKLFNDEQHRKQIFTPHNWKFLGFYKYKTDPKLSALLRASNDALALRMDAGHYPCKLVIPAYDYQRNRARMFRTYANPASAYNAASEVRLVDAVHASTNAPIAYFNAPAKVTESYGRGQRTDEYWDGAMAGFNNPCLAGIVEALNLGIAQDKIDVVSLGTTNKHLPLYHDLGTAPVPYTERKAYGLIDDVVKGALTVLKEPPLWAVYTAHTLLKNTGTFIRVNPMIAPYSIAQPGDQYTYQLPAVYAQDSTAWQELLDLDLDAVKETEVAAIRRWAMHYFNNEVRNEPVQFGAGLTTRIGHPHWQDAEAAVRALLHLSHPAPIA